MPYSKTGGLADIGAALPLALHRLGCDIRVLTPLYGSIDSTHYGLKPAGPKSAITMRGAELPIQFLETEMSGGLPVYFLENDALYDRPGIYVDPFSNKDYLDNDYRYVALSKSAPALCRMLDWQPDIAGVGAAIRQPDGRVIAFNAGGSASKFPRELLEQEIGPQLARMVKGLEPFVRSDEV